jgi:hypothetical protein
MGVLLVLECGSGGLLLEYGVLPFFEGLRELEQTSTFSHEKKNGEKNRGKDGHGCGRSGFDTKRKVNTGRIWKLGKITMEKLELECKRKHKELFERP